MEVHEWSLWVLFQASHTAIGSYTVMNTDTSSCGFSLSQVFAQQQNHPANPGNLLSSSGDEAIVSGKVHWNICVRMHVSIRFPWHPVSNGACWSVTCHVTTLHCSHTYLAAKWFLLQGSQPSPSHSFAILYFCQLQWRVENSEEKKNSTIYSTILYKRDLIFP